MRLTRRRSVRTRAYTVAAALTVLLVASAPVPAGASPPEPVTAGTAATSVDRAPTADPRATPPYPLREGDPFYAASGSRCTIGALVPGGYLTAGHCASVGTAVDGFNGEPQGTFVASTFPGSDFALVAVNDDWEPEPSFSGTQEAPVGAAVCMAGSTTGVRCGTITATNQTIAFPQGTLYGMTRTNLCRATGDSGAPVYHQDQLQGLVSGGSGSCAAGGVTYFQPINPALAALGTHLLTS